jgi:flagella basal body P-ring formation protein FlgA
MSQHVTKFLRMNWLIAVLATLFVCEIRAEEQTQLELKQTLEHAIALSASNLTGVRAQNIKALIWDNRLRVEPCPEYIVAFPYSDRVTVEVKCPETNWKIYTRIRILDASRGYRYLRGLIDGSILTRGDIDQQLIDTADAHNTVTNINDVIGYTLTRAVSINEIVKHSDFVQDNASTLSEDTSAELDKRLVLTASGSVSRGQRLRQLQFDTQPISTRTPKDAIPESIDVKYLETTRNLVQGDFLRYSNTKPTAAIKKGELLTLLISRSAITVTAQVRALEDASIGAIIEMENLESGKIIFGRVTDIGAVEPLM